MSRKYSSGQDVYYEPQFGNNASRGTYKIVRLLPIESDRRLSYRIKSTTESSSGSPKSISSPAPTNSPSIYLALLSGTERKLSLENFRGPTIVAGAE